MSRLRAIRAAAVVATFMVPLATVAVSATAATAGTPSITQACTSHVKDDFNGDGHADIAVTQANSTKGDMGLGKSAVRVLYGSTTGVTKTNNQYLDGSELGAAFTPTDEDIFGIGTAIGDFNGDGCADLAVVGAGIDSSSTTDITTHGFVIVYYGSPTGLNSASAPTATVIPETSIVPAAQDSTSFIQSAAAGDFNGDHIDDLVVGVPDSDITSETSDTGGIAVLDGSASGLTTAGKQWFTQASTGVVGTAESFDEFGLDVAAGDFNGDGNADIAVGAPEQTVASAEEAGTVTVLYGVTGTGLAGAGSQQWNQNSTSVPGTAEDGDGFGETVAAGDVNKDGKADLVVGTPDEAIGSLDSAGTITLLKGSATGLTGTGSQSFDQNSSGIPGTSEKGDEFGTSVSIGDFNGDGFGDVAVGVPGEAIGSLTDAGEVNVIYGNSGGLTGTGSQGWTQNSSGISGGSEKGDQMGFMVQAVNLTSATHADLVSTAPYEDSSSMTDNGLLNIILGSGSKTGLTSTGNQGIDATGLIHGPVNYGLFGVVLAGVSAAA